MRNIKNWLQHHRFFLENMGIVVLCESAAIFLLEDLTPRLGALHSALLDVYGLAFLVGPFIFWLSHVVHDCKSPQVEDRVYGCRTEASLAASHAAIAPAAETQPITHPLHVYWLQSETPPSLPLPASLLHKGVVLEVLDSVQALALRLEDAAPAGLLFLDMATATSPEMGAWLMSNRSAIVQAMPMIAVAEVATEAQMQACRRAGVIDLVPRQFALSCMHVMAKRYLDDQGQPRADVKQNIAAIDSQHAMAFMRADAAFFGTLLRVFFDELAGRRKHLQDDWVHHPQQIKNHCHALKGLALTLGLHHLAEVAVKTETLAVNGTVLDAQLLVQLQGELQSVGFQILRWLAFNEHVAEVTQ